MAYNFKGTDYPSVTTITRILDKPALVSWAAKTAIEHIQENLELIRNESDIHIVEDVLEDAKKDKVVEPKPKRNFIVLYLILSMIVVTGLFVWMKYNVTWEVNGGTSILVASLSIMINIIILGAVFATGIGRKLIKRFKQRLMYNSGKYVNDLFLSKSGTMHEHFVKVNSKHNNFKIEGNNYIRNPSLLINFDKIPTYLHREGTPDPMNPWDNKLAGEMSCAEVDTVMNSANSFDIKAWLEQNKMLLVFVCGIFVIAAGAGAYFGYQAWIVLRDGTGSVMCNNLPVATETAKQIIEQAIIG